MKEDWNTKLYCFQWHIYRKLYMRSYHWFVSKTLLKMVKWFCDQPMKMQMGQIENVNRDTKLEWECLHFTFCYTYFAGISLLVWCLLPVSTHSALAGLMVTLRFCVRLFVHVSQHTAHAWLCIFINCHGHPSLVSQARLTITSYQSCWSECTINSA